uniref:Uncharacterized protein n=1 Tax=Anguilla anguilla TaxID=7936 RepID=A0A0E9X8Y3_ANGAN
MDTSHTTLKACMACHTAVCTKHCRSTLHYKCLSTPALLMQVHLCDIHLKNDLVTIEVWFIKTDNSK